MCPAEPFVRESSGAGLPPVRGYLYRPAAGSATGQALVLTHGAGSDARSPLLAAVAGAFSRAGFLALACDLPFRQARPAGPPFPAAAPSDREGLRQAVTAMRQLVPGPVYLGGHSYGGRQASILASEVPELAAGLLLLSYPLHPPRRPTQLRTAHFPRLRLPALFVHGRRDPFGSPEEMEAALALIPGPAVLRLVDGGHDLPGLLRHPDWIAAEFPTVLG